MTNTTKSRKISTMAIRPRLQIDMDNKLSYALDQKAGEQSVQEGRKITKREIVLVALRDKYPDLSPLINKEL